MWLELGVLEPREEKYVVIPYTTQAGVEHRYSLTLYTDKAHLLEKVDPSLVMGECNLCSRDYLPPGVCWNCLVWVCEEPMFEEVLGRLDRLEEKWALVGQLQAACKARGLFSKSRRRAEGGSKEQAAVDKDKVRNAA